VYGLDLLRFFGIIHFPKVLAQNFVSLNVCASIFVVLKKLISLILSSDAVRASLYESDENVDAFDETAVVGSKSNVRVSNDIRSSTFSQVSRESLRWSEISPHRPTPFKNESIVQFS